MQSISIEQILKIVDNNPNDTDLGKAIREYVARDLGITPTIKREA